MHYSDDEAIGYRKPPRRTQFKKGQSGNPRGRPKGSTLRSAVEKVLDRAVTVTIDGERRKVPITEALVMQLAQRALGGDLPAAREVLKIGNQVAQTRKEDEAADGNNLRIEIIDVLETYACGPALEALEVIEQGHPDPYQYRIQPWVVEAALARGLELTEAQRKQVEKFTIQAGDTVRIAHDWRMREAGRSDP